MLPAGLQSTHASSLAGQAYVSAIIPLLLAPTAAVLHVWGAGSDSASSSWPVHRAAFPPRQVYLPLDWHAQVRSEAVPDCVLRFRNLDAEAGRLHQAVPLRSVLILTHALEHFTLFKCVGDFVLLSGNTVWQIVTLYNQQLSYREVLTRLVAHNTFQIVWDLSGRSSLRALQFLGACMCFLLFPGLAARLMATVAGPIAGLVVYKWGFVAELGLGCVYCCNKLRQRGQP